MHGRANFARIHMDEDELHGLDGPVERMRRDWEGRLSTIQGRGGDARLRRAMRYSVRLRGRKAGVPEPPLADGAVLLAKAARRTAVWLGLDAATFESATGLALVGYSIPIAGTPSWAACLVLVRLAGRLERQLGRRGVVRAWLHSPHTALEPNPVGVLAMPDGARLIADYLDHFER